VQQPQLVSRVAETGAFRSRPEHTVQQNTERPQVTAFADSARGPNRPQNGTAPSSGQVPISLNGPQARHSAWLNQEPIGSVQDRVGHAPDSDHKAHPVMQEVEEVVALRSTGA